VGSRFAKPWDMMRLSGVIGTLGLALVSAFMLQTLGPLQSSLHCGCAQASEGLQFQLHCGSAQRLSQLLEQTVWQSGGPQMVLHFGHSSCSHCVVGHTTAHLGGPHLWWHIESSRVPQDVSHFGGAQTGLQTWSHPPPQLHVHLGWQPLALLSDS